MKIRILFSLIHKQPQDLVFEPRESSRRLTIANDPILAIWGRLRSSIFGDFACSKSKILRLFVYTTLFSQNFLSAENSICATFWQVYTDEEALALRRIADFWQEGEYFLAKQQIEAFLKQYPDSLCAGQLYVALGDLHLRNKDYADALNDYSRADGEAAEGAFLNRMHCLYHLQWYATLADECEKFLETHLDGDAHQRLQVTYFLATALFQQCLNAEKDPVMVEALAKRAEPLFAELFESELSEEVAQAFAHLCSVLRHYDRASEIYLSLARGRESSSEEAGELLFQAALLQSEYDPELAIKTFTDIGGAHVKEAAYHRLLLLFRAGRYEEFLSFQGEVPADKSASIQLHRGQSYAALGQYPEAIKELSRAISDSDQRYAALSSLLDTAHAAGDLDTFQTALGQLVTNYPGDSKESSARFAYAQLLKRAQRMTEARKELEILFGQLTDSSEEGAHIAFELAHLDFQEERWEECRTRSFHFLSRFGESSLAPYVWHYLASSSLQLNQAEQLAEDVERLLAQSALFSEEEKLSWQLILAKTYLELQRYDAATALLEPLAENHPNAQLLLALCLRDGKRDLPRFCTLAEGALAASNFSMADRGQLHLALFDAYLEQGEPNEDHLYRAFQLGASICRENLEWLADFYFKQVEEEAEFADPYFASTRDAETLERAMRVIESLIAQGELSRELKSQLLNHERYNTLLSRLGRIYALCGESDRQVALLESSEDPELRLWLADGYRALGQLDEALTLYDALAAQSVTLRQFVGAKASLEAARLKRSTHPDQAAVQLKSLMVQRHLPQEPIYLDAAMEYADLVSTSSEKRLTVLNKIRSDFESQADLLSQDYHRARAQLPKKDELYRAYLQLMDAEILFCRSQWMDEEWVKKAMQTEAKEMLQALLKPSQPASLTARAQRALDKMNE